MSKAHTIKLIPLCLGFKNDETNESLNDEPSLFDDLAG